MAAVVFLWAAYRVLGTPSRLQPVDYEVVLEDLFSSVRRAADRLKAVNPESEQLEQEAAEARKIFQTAYYQALRLKPAAGQDNQATLRGRLAETCQAYEWAARLLEQEGTPNQMLRQAATTLLERADAQLERLSGELKRTERSP